MSTSTRWAGVTEERPVSPPEIAAIALTRVAIGAGLGLLLADRLGDDTRRGAGWALLAMGVISTFPLLLNVLRKPRAAPG